MIKTITIKRVKGIESKTFELNLNPNKPAIIVAPNGFGKSSLAIAFNSLNRDRMVLHKDNLHKEQVVENWSLSMSIKKGNDLIELIADKTQNQIAKSFDTFVINNKLIAKTKQQSYNGQTVASSSIEVAPIILITSIPEKCNLNYSYKDIKTALNCGNILPNLTDVLKIHKLIIEVNRKIDFKKFKGKKVEAVLSKAKTKISNTSGTIKEIEKSLELAIIPDLKNLDEMVKLSCLIKQHSNIMSDMDSFLAAIQIIHIVESDNANFKKTAKYYDYLDEKNEYDQLFSTIQKTWQNIHPTEDKTKGLIVRFPKANLISNGERDFINFLSSLIATKRKIKKENCILIIDEVFDYLDDSNLITAQYYISRMIIDLKGTTMFYPIILTHLNPYYFKNYRFQKQQVIYLDQHAYKKNIELENLIKKRGTLDKCDFKDTISRYYLHFDPNYKNVNCEKEFQAHGLNSKYDTPRKFRDNIWKELDLYINDDINYDPISICSAVRLKIEESIFNEFANKNQQSKFVETFETDKKLRYAEAEGIDFPETFNLLGVIYNEAMHLNDNTDKLTPICSKLNNRLIKKMIQEVVNQQTL